MKGRELIMAAMEDRPYDVAAAVEELTEMVDSLCLGPSTASIVDAADDRDIPAIRLLEDGNLVQIGYGAAMRRIWTAETDRTSAIAEGISRDKDLTKSLLSSCGVPVPEGREVDSPEDAWDAAQDIGLPVVVKPVDGNHGRGVFIDLKSREEVEKAYAVAVDEGSGVLVERSIPGTEHRLLVIGGKMVAANRGDMIKVMGDGKSTVRELIELQINCDPRRGPTENHPLSVIRIDTAARIELERQGLSGDSVPAAGKEVLIQRNANHEFDCTDEVHPETAHLVSLAARIVGLDIAGVDLVAEDISRPLEAQGGAIVEVNAGPSLLMHLKPGVGKSRPVGKAVVDLSLSEKCERSHPGRRDHRFARQDRRRAHPASPAADHRQAHWRRDQRWSLPGQASRREEGLRPLAAGAARADGQGRRGGDFREWPRHHPRRGTGLRPLPDRHRHQRHRLRTSSRRLRRTERRPVVEGHANPDRCRS
jgi:cyanophycin synthetase